jgi:5-methylthioadenosine/S-adenosylhomocysteine deaminase
MHRALLRSRLLRAAFALALVCLFAGAVVPAAWPAPKVRRVSIIITGGVVVTVDPDRRILSPGAVAIDGRTIVAVDRPEVIAASFRAAETLNASGTVVMPGLINTHTHAPMVMYAGSRRPGAHGLAAESIFPAEAKTVSPEFVRTGARLAALEMIGSGTTTYADMYYFEEEIARITRNAGLRGVLGETIISFPSPDAKTPSEGLARNEAFIKEFAHDELITPAVAPHSMYTLDREWLQSSRRLADRYEAPLLIHIAETQGEVETSRERHHMAPFAYLDSIGFLGPRVVAAHAVWVGDDEIPVLVRSDVGISHNPESNMKLASGAAPIPKFLSAGLAVGLGTDGAASNNDLDMFEAMRQAAFLHKLQTGDPTVVGAPAAVEMATIGGARVLGLEKLVGSLEPGKRADVILVSMREARQTPMYNPVSHLVYLSKGPDVRTTIVNGRVLMRDRRVLTLDEPAVLAEARKMAEPVRGGQVKVRGYRLQVSGRSGLQLQAGLILPHLSTKIPRRLQAFPP